MKIHNWKMRSLLPLVLIFCFAGSKVHSQESKSTDSSEIVMTKEELESLLTTIAERRKEKLKNKQALQLPAYQLGRAVTYQDPRMYQDLRNLEYKLDLLLSRANILPNQGSTTTLNIPYQQSGIAPQQPVPATANNLSEGGREVLKGHQVFFANNSTNITAGDKRIIKDLIPMIKEKQNQVLVVLKGYASQVGNAFYNNQLSYNRADAIKQLLVNNGVSPGNIMILYHGADKTVRASEARRVEITLELIPHN